MNSDIHLDMKGQGKGVTISWAALEPSPRIEGVDYGPDGNTLFDMYQTFIYGRRTVVVYWPVELREPVVTGTES